MDDSLASLYIRAIVSESAVTHVFRQHIHVLCDPRIVHQRFKNRRQITNGDAFAEEVLENFLNGPCRKELGGEFFDDAGYSFFRFSMQFLRVLPAQYLVRVARSTSCRWVESTADGSTTVYPQVPPALGRRPVSRWQSVRTPVLCTSTARKPPRPLPGFIARYRSIISVPVAATFPRILIMYSIRDRAEDCHAPAPAG